MLGEDVSAEGRLEALRLALLVPVGAAALGALVTATGLGRSCGVTASA